MPQQLLGHHKWRGEQYLLAAMLEAAKQDLRYQGPSVLGLKVKADALQWIMDTTDWEGGFSFLFCCSALYLDPDATRRELLTVATGTSPRSHAKMLHCLTGKWQRGIA